MRGYTVLNQEIRTGKNAKQLVLRAAQFSKSDPQGPSYLIASREALEENIEPYSVDVKKWKPLAPRGLAPSSVQQIAESLLTAKSPVVVTTYLGRDTSAVAELVKLCETNGIAVLVSRNHQTCKLTFNMLTSRSSSAVGGASFLYELPTRPSSICRQSLE